MSKTIVLDEATTGAVHALLAGKPTNLNEIVRESKQAIAGGPVTWSIPVTPATVHTIVTICQFAADNGVLVELQSPRDLNEQESIFHDDFLLRGLPRNESLLQRFKHSLSENWMLLRDALKVCANFKSLADSPVRLDDSRYETALLIGQYGGEHVGDAAILGGVLIGLHRDYGTVKAHLLSHRPEHTARLVKGLQTPVNVETHSSNNQEIASLLDRSNLLVFAGGPIMDLPRVLAKQAAVACSARNSGLPIVIDRVGVGPFKRRTSRFVARRVVDFASCLSVRTVAAAKDPVVVDLRPEVRRDPAFEYLETRKNLTRLCERDVESVRVLVSNTDDRLRIGINLRPIRHLWSPQGESFSIGAEKQFIDQFAKALVVYSDSSMTPVSYMFFSMNPQEFGMSDLRIAYELHKELGDKVDFRVWQADPDVDGVLHLLRQMDFAVTMRFHACIFAITQDVPTLGIDYYPGLGGKVEQLFADRDCSDDVRRMDLFDIDWFLSSMRRMEPGIHSRLRSRK